MFMTERVLSYPAHVPRFPARVRLGPRRRELHPAVLLPAAAAFALLSGYLVSMGYGFLMIAGLVGLALVVFAVVRPDLAVLVWIAVLLSWGRNFTHLGTGQLYITEAFLALMALAIGARLLTSTVPKPGVKLTFALAGLLWVPAVAGVALNTDLSNLDWTYEFAIIVYSLFAVIGAVVYQMPGFRRRLVIAIFVGATIGLLLPLQEGSSHVTATGALRFAAGQYTIGYVAAMLLIIVAVRERLTRRLALVAVLPYLAGLIFVNHRSAWMGFGAAVALLLASRPTASSRLVFLACTVCLGFFAVTAYAVSPTSNVGNTVHRATTTSNTSDPNNKYRLAFWKEVVRASTASPIVGSGFDRYPREFIPHHSLAHEEDHPAPHNSWIALAYRIGPLFLLFLVGGLSWLVVRSNRFARHAEDPRRRLALGGLAAFIAYLAIFASFNVVLELPYMAVLFWLGVGFLAAELLQTTETSPAGQGAPARRSRPRIPTRYAPRHAR